MSKKRRLEQIDLTEWPTPKFCNTNWPKCILCQTDTDQALATPTASGYKSLSDHLLEFAKYEALPRDIRLPELDDGSGLLQTFTTNSAKYHKVLQI